MGLSEWLGIEGAREGWVRMPLSSRTRNQVGDFHGGSLVSLAEEAAARVVPPDLACTPGLCATALNINYIRPANTPWVTARAGLLWAGESGCACQVEIRSEHGKETCRALIQFGVLLEGMRPGASGPAAEPSPQEADQDGSGLRYDREAGESYRNALGIRSLQMRHGLVELMFPATPDYTGPDGLLPLGLLAGFMDNGGGQTLLGYEPPHWTATINLQAHLLRRIPPQTVFARIRALRQGRQVGVIAGTVFAGGIPAAAGMATFIMKRD